MTRHANSSIPNYTFLDIPRIPPVSIRLVAMLSSCVALEDFD